MRRPVRLLEHDPEKWEPVFGKDPCSNKKGARASELERGDVDMRVTAALVIAGLLLSSSAHAGPCSNAIAQFEQTVRQSANNPDAGPTARQSIGAQLDRQPTPGSVARAEARAEGSFDAALARAKRLDARGNRAGCSRALAAAKRMYNPQ
jgi:hypothetical protein